jgi:Tfp pilus assembly protein PilF
MVDSLLERASQLIQHQRFSEAEIQIREALTTDPNNPGAIMLLAICKSESGAHAEAIELGKKAIGLEPDNDYHLYLTGLFLYRHDSMKEAEKMVNNAIAFNPQEAAYFALSGMIQLHHKSWAAALEQANAGLALDGENTMCLNIRSTAQLKLGMKEESFETVREALQQNPQDSFTHGNVGWGLLEHGDHQKALEHFREALKLNPHNEHAKAGLVEALKARYWFYRIFLRYNFWVSNMKNKGQWFLIIGLYVGVRILRVVADNNEAWAPFLIPVIYLYFAFAISTWLMEPLSNLFLRLNVYGRYALRAEEIRSSNFVGVALALAILSGILALGGVSAMIPAVVYCLLMMIPLASMYNPRKESSQKILVIYTAVVGLMGAIGVWQLAFNEEGIFAGLFLLGIVLYQWVANALMIR